MPLRRGGGSFDLDLRYGKVAEELVRQLLFAPERYEVKRQDRAPEYGTLYIETEHDKGARGTFTPSGLSITDADYWVFVIQSHIIFTPTSWLRDMQPYCRAASLHDGSCPTRGFRLPLKWCVLMDLPK